MRTCFRSRGLSLVLVLAVLVVCVGMAQAQPRAKYVFLMIGDGMGLAQRTAGELAINGESSKNPASYPGKLLAMNDMPTMGLARTHSSSSLVTDSAAAGTALACGKKTSNGTVSMDADHKVALPTIAEVAKQAGKKVAIISSVNIDHATPACFYAHQPKRGDYYEIAMQLADSGFDFFGGASQGETKARGRDKPVAKAEEAGYRIVRSSEALKAVTGGKVWAWSPVIEGGGALPTAIDQPNVELSIAELTREAIRLLDNPNGFFVMVEGGMIDWTSHANDAVAAVGETLAFDAAVEEAVAFYRKHPTETLVVVTADHETGGMGLGAIGGSMSASGLTRQTMSGGQMGKTFSELRKGEVAFEDALPQLAKLLGVDGFSEGETAELKDAYERSLLANKGKANENELAYQLYANKDPLTVACMRISSRRGGVAWTTFSHTGIPVPTSAIGVGHERFGGYYDNTAIFGKIVGLMGVGTNSGKAVEQ